MWNLRKIGIAGAMIGIQFFALGARAEEWVERRDQAVARFQREYEGIVREHGEDAGVAAFRERAETLDRIVELAEKELGAAARASIGAALGEKKGGTKDGESKALAGRALRMVMDHEEAFAGLPRPGIGEEQLEVLVGRYNATLSAAAEHIQRRALRVIRTESRLTVEVVPFCLVIPFLHAGDEAWSASRMGALPGWMGEPASLRAMEAFALLSRRPRTAYLIATQHSAEADRGRMTLAGYVVGVSKKLVDAREYHSALRAMEVGISAAEEAGATDEAQTLRMRLGGTLGEMGHAKLAGDQYQEFLKKYPQSSKFGEAAMLRLRWLYESEQFGAIVKEAPGYAADARAEAYLPQTLYMLWGSHRRLNNIAEAGRVQEDFVKRYPRHALCADMYFAVAMTEMTLSNYGEALRLLEIIEYRYPGSTLMPKVRELQGRIRQPAAKGTGK